MPPDAHACSSLLKSRNNHPICIYRYTDVSGVRKRCTLCQRNQRSDHAVCHCDHAFYGAVVFLYLTVYFRFFTASPFFTPNTSIPIRTGASKVLVALPNTAAYPSAAQAIVGSPATLPTTKPRDTQWWKLDLPFLWWFSRFLHSSGTYSMVSWWYVPAFYLPGHMRVFFFDMSQFFYLTGHMQVFLFDMSQFFYLPGHIQNLFHFMSPDSWDGIFSNIFLLYVPFSLPCGTFSNYFSLYVPFSPPCGIFLAFFPYMSKFLHLTGFFWHFPLYDPFSLCNT